MGTSVSMDHEMAMVICILFRVIMDLYRNGLTPAKNLHYKIAVSLICRGNTIIE